MVKPYVIGVDPSGAFKEGKGTTGFCVLSPDCNLIEHFTVTANDYQTRLDYWRGVLKTIGSIKKRYKNVVLSVEDYVLYESAAKAQINSEMETSKLIGAIEMYAYENDIPIYKRVAAMVKKRWTNPILEHMGVICKRGARWTDKCGSCINQHSMDAIRHAMHCYQFEIGKEKKRR